MPALTCLTHGKRADASQPRKEVHKTGLEVGDRVVIPCELGEDRADVWRVVAVRRAEGKTYGSVDIVRTTGIDRGGEAHSDVAEEVLVEIGSPLYLVLRALGKEHKLLGRKRTKMLQGVESGMSISARASIFAKMDEILEAKNILQLAGKHLLLTWKEGR